MDDTRITISAVADDVMLSGKNEQEAVLFLVAVGESFKVKLRGQWCQVRLASGGYKGRYYITPTGERGRLALGMEASPCQQEQAKRRRKTQLERARAMWVGKVVESRVPLAGGLVRGVVREITEGGRVVLVYTPHFNQVPVLVSFTVEWIADILSLAREAA
jgi:hypothetical protein